MNIPELYEVYKTNVFPAMLDDLANSLGLSASTIAKLGIGFNPDAQSWIFPERDAKGNVIGLLQRHQDGSKLMIKSSKRGLTYVVNQDYNQGKTQFYPGKHHWVRTTQKLPCPICGRIKWCLVSSIDIYNPPAVICTKISKGSVKHFPDCGYLHVLDADRNINDSPAHILESSKNPVIIVEGQTDVLAAMELGFVAVGRPSALGKTDLLPGVCYSRNAIVIGDNNPDGVGRKGMEAAANKLSRCCPVVQQVLPPQGIKDLREWVTDYDLTKEKLFNWMNENATTIDNKLLLDNDGADYLARKWIENRWTHGERVLLCKYLEDYYIFQDTKYTIIDRDTLFASMWSYFEGKNFISSKDVKPLRMTRPKMGDILSAASLVTPLITKVPCWVYNPESSNAKELIPFKNGQLDIATDKFYDITPNYFNVSHIPYKYNPELKSELWYKFLQEVFGGDNERIKLLGEWFGYVLSSNREYEKFMLLVGVPRSGKSTILEVLSHTIGADNSVSTSFSRLAERFGLANLVHKKAVMIGDARTSNQRIMDKALAITLQITGNDSLAIDRKGRTIITDKLPGAFTLAMNELPAFSDYANAVQTRALMLGFDISFAGREDITLKHRLIREANQGKILEFALNGWKRLQEQGNFTQPQNSKEIAGEFNQLVSPLATFVSMCCVVETDKTIPCLRLFAAWQEWTRAWGYRPGKVVQFGRWLKAYSPLIQHNRLRINGELMYVYGGIDLTQSAKQTYLNYPGG